MINRLIAYASEFPVRALAIALGLFMAIGSSFGALIGLAANTPTGFEIGSFAGIVLAGSLFGALLGCTIARASRKAIAARAILGSATWGIAILVWLLILEEFGRAMD